MPFGTWKEVGLVVFLGFFIVLATKVGAIGAAIGARLARKR